MAFNLHRDQRHQFQATAGVPTVIGIDAPATTLAAAFYNRKSVPISATGTITFSPIPGDFFLTIVAQPSVPPERWNVVEFDGGNKQLLESEFNDDQSTSLVIVGNTGVL